MRYDISIVLTASVVSQRGGLRVAPALFWRGMSALRANVYIDGFNLYYGALRDTPYRWLDLYTLFTTLLPAYDINRVRYFTAVVKPRPGNPHQAQRQLAYLRALEASTPRLTVHRGQFLESQIEARVVTPPPTRQRVYKSEEKGSDVNLASFLLLDAFKTEYDVAAVVSNDTDLITPIEMVKHEFGRRIFVFNPHDRASWPMRNAASAPTDYRRIRAGVLAASQLPPTLTDAVGTITKPPGW